MIFLINLRTTGVDMFYGFYILVVLLTTTIAFIGEKNVKKNNGELLLKKKYIVFIALILVAVMGLRKPTVGVDTENYLSIYNDISNNTFLSYYSNKFIEPGYYLLNKIIFLLFNDFQYVLVTSSIIIVYPVIVFIKYIFENYKISFTASIFVYTLTQYFYYIGIVRLGMAVGILSIGLIYLFNRNKKKFMLYVLLASTFHISALFALLYLFIDVNRKINKKHLVMGTAVILIGILTIRYGVFNIFSLLELNKYNNYMEAEISLGFESIHIIVLSLFFVFTVKFFTSKNNFSSYLLVLVILRFIIQFFAPMVGIGRVIWYFNVVIPLLFGYNIKNIRDKQYKIIFMIIMIVYSIGYSYYAYFGQSYRAEFLLPYEFFFQ